MGDVYLLSLTSLHACLVAGEGDSTNMLQPNDWATKHRFAFEIASGMAFVHSFGKVHRDLKSGNILATFSNDGEVTLKVADFGAATIFQKHNSDSGNAVDEPRVRSGTGRVREFRLLGANSSSSSLRSQPPRSNSGGRSESLGIGAEWVGGDPQQTDSGVHWSAHMTADVGTLLWMAPEILLKKQKYGPEVDLYSYGIVLWEIAAQSIPWRHLDLNSNEQRDALLERIEYGDRPTVSPQWPRTYVDMMRRCWALEVSWRPPFPEVEKYFQTIVGGQGVQGGASGGGGSGGST